VVLRTAFACIASSACLLGTLIGVLPGIGPLATIAMLLPITFGLPPVGALIMLAGIYYGAQYGGSTTAILVNMPGEAPRSSPRSTATRWPAGPRRRRARHRRDRLVLRRHGRHLLIARSRRR
jgi:TctA family transporter